VRIFFCVVMNNRNLKLPKMKRNLINKIQQKNPAVKIAGFNIIS
jgi:hypothetical protein